MKQLLSTMWSAYTNPSKRVSVKTVLSIDLRSMALMRVMLATLIIVDLLLRASNINLFYTDTGLLPRSQWLEITGNWYLSLHAASGALWWQVVLFLLAGVAAIGLLIGYRTRLMTVLSWLLLISLCNRNVLVLQAGDVLLMIMCFWGMFLPLGAKWSVDAALQPEYLRNPNQRRFEPKKAQLFFSVATVAVIFQVLFLYFFTAILKTGAPWRFPFEAALYTLEIQHFVTPIGEWFKGFKPILPVATVYVLVVELVAPLLVLLPFYWVASRVVGLLMLASLHIAFSLLIHLGLFPLIDLMSLTLLIPSAIWVAHAKRKQQSSAANITLYYDEDCGFCLKMCLILREWLLPDTVKILPAQTVDKIFAIMERENSWVIEDEQGHTFCHWHAMAFLFTQNWITKPVGWVMKFPPLMWIGNQLYRTIADNRPTMSKLSERLLPARPLKLHVSKPAQAIALYCFIVVIAYNISTLPRMSWVRIAPIDISAQLLRIDQRWSMFAPEPLSFSLYPQVEGKLRNGDSVNLYELTQTEPDWIAPHYMYPLYSGYRFRKYFDRIRTSQNPAPRHAFGHYQCRSWNTKERNREQQLGILSLHFVKLHSNSTGEPKEQTRGLVWEHWCYPEFKPN